MSKASNDVNNFLRTLSEEEKNEYQLIKGHRANERKREFRTLINSQRLANGKASQKNVSSSAESDTVVGTYRNFWVIVEKEGGLMDRDFGIRIATNICTHCETKGPPAFMWDPAAKCIKYLHAEMGKSDIQTKARQSILSADAEMDDETVRRAMQQAENEGLSASVPPEELRQFPGSGAKDPGPAPEVTGNEAATPKLAPETNILEIAKSLLAKPDETKTPESSIVNAMLLQQLLDAQKKKAYR